MKKEVVIPLIVASLALVYISGDKSTSSLEEIQQLQESKLQTDSKYVQILPGNQTPDGRKLNKNIPDNMRIDIYETANGEQGYVIIYEDDTNIYSVGYGVEAEARTFVTPKPVFIASSTRQ